MPEEKQNENKVLNEIGLPEPTPEEYYDEIAEHLTKISVDYINEHHISYKEMAEQNIYATFTETKDRYRFDGIIRMDMGYDKIFGFGGVVGLPFAGTGKDLLEEIKMSLEDDSGLDETKMEESDKIIMDPEKKWWELYKTENYKGHTIAVYKQSNIKLPVQYRYHAYDTGKHIAHVVFYSYESAIKDAKNRVDDYIGEYGENGIEERLIGKNLKEDRYQHVGTAMDKLSKLTTKEDRKFRRELENGIYGVGRLGYLSDMIDTKGGDVAALEMIKLMDEYQQKKGGEVKEAKIGNVDPAKKHQTKIAKDTLKMSDAGANIMGGMTKPEAREFLKSVGWSDKEIAKLEESKMDKVNETAEVVQTLRYKGYKITVYKNHSPRFGDMYAASDDSGEPETNTQWFKKPEAAIAAAKSAIDNSTESDEDMVESKKVNEMSFWSRKAKTDQQEYAIRDLEKSLGRLGFVFANTTEGGQRSLRGVIDFTLTGTGKYKGTYPNMVSVDEGGRVTIGKSHPDPHSVGDVKYAIDTYFKKNESKEEDTVEPEAEKEDIKEPETKEEAKKEEEVDLPGGKADGMSDEEFDPEALAKGTEVEMEHTDDEGVAKDIAKDHLSEFEGYYDALADMEDELREEEDGGGKEEDGGGKEEEEEITQPGIAGEESLGVGVDKEEEELEESKEEEPEEEIKHVAKNDAIRWADKRTKDTGKPHSAYYNKPGSKMHVLPDDDKRATLYKKVKESKTNEMKSYDFDAMVLNGEVYCTKHLNTRQRSVADPIFADSEWDSYPVCTKCGAVHDYVNLTDEGRKAEGVDESKLNEVYVIQSPEYYKEKYNLTDIQVNGGSGLTPKDHTIIGDVVIKEIGDVDTPPTPVYTGNWGLISWLKFSRKYMKESKIEEANFKPGDKARTIHGVGVGSNRLVTIVDRSEIKTKGNGIPTNVEGAYKPVDWSREVAFKYDDNGKYDTMIKTWLKPVTNESKKLTEIKVTFDKHEFNVELVEDTEAGITININGKQDFKFTPEFTSMFRNAEGKITDEGLKEMGQSALSNLSEEYFDKLADTTEEPVETAESGEEPMEDTNESKKCCGKNKKMKKLCKKSDAKESKIPDDKDSDQTKIDKLTEEKDPVFDMMMKHLNG